MSAEEPPVVFDTVVLSNFAASDSLDWLCGRFRAPRTVGAVERELRRGRAEGYTFVERAIDVIGTEIMVIDADEAAVEQFSKHVDTGGGRSPRCRADSTESSPRTIERPASWHANVIFRSPGRSESLLMAYAVANSTQKPLTDGFRSGYGLLDTIPPIETVEELL